MKYLKVIAAIILACILTGCSYAGGKKISIGEISTALHKKYDAEFRVRRNVTNDAGTLTFEQNRFVAYAFADDTEFDVWIVPTADGYEIRDNYEQKLRLKQTYEYAVGKITPVLQDCVIKVSGVMPDRSFTAMVLLPYSVTLTEETLECIYTDLSADRECLFICYIVDNVDYKNVYGIYKDMDFFTGAMNTGTFVPHNYVCARFKADDIKYILVRGDDISKEDFEIMEANWKEGLSAY